MATSITRSGLMAKIWLTEPEPSSLMLISFSTRRQPVATSMTTTKPPNIFNHRIPVPLSVSARRRSYDLASADTANCFTQRAEPVRPESSDPPAAANDSQLPYTAVPGPGRSLLQAAVTVLALIAIGASMWWAVRAPEPETAEGERIVPATPAAVATAEATSVTPDAGGDDPAATPATTPAGEPTQGPTATTIPPTPTAEPVPVPFVDLAAGAVHGPTIGALGLGDLLAPPIDGCSLYGGPSVGGTMAVRCIETIDTTAVNSVAPGRVVNVVREVPVLELGGLDAPTDHWSWGSQALLGPHVVVDHGPLAGARNVQTVYAGLLGIADDIVVGAPVDQGTPLGTVAGPRPTVFFQLWIDDTRQDGARVLADAPPAEVQRAIATAIGEQIVPAIDERCPITFGFSALPGASRAYRNGTHRGIDFGCGTSDRDVYAVADGTVVYLVNDYQDPTVAHREQLLRNAGIAGFTPHWTLVMLYGNVVVVDHGELPGVGRMVTISAHLESVDPTVVLGGRVEAGQRLGEAGNRGTNASAQGVRGSADPSLHLHWELYVDGWYLGAGAEPAQVTDIITSAMCGATPTAGCPPLG